MKSGAASAGPAERVLSGEKNHLIKIISPLRHNFQSAEIFRNPKCEMRKKCE